MMTKSLSNNKLFSRAVLSKEKSGLLYLEKMAEKDRFQFSNFNEIFGELQSVHHVRQSKFQTITVPAILFLLFLGSVIAYRESGDFWAIPFCTLPFFLLFCGVLWNIFASRRAELKIYENGFTYRSGKNLQTCLWDEIFFYDIRERNEFEMSEKKKKGYPISYVRKKNEETIKFHAYMTGTIQISRHRQNTGAKSRKKNAKAQNK